MDQSAPWAAVLDEIEREIDEGIAGGARPFRPGQRVYAAGYPHYGSLTVRECVPYPDGVGWQVTAVDGGYVSMGPADMYRAWPDGLREPPQPPSLAEFYRVGLDDVWARREAQTNPEWRRAWARFREDHERWLRELRERQQ